MTVVVEPPRDAEATALKDAAAAADDRGSWSGKAEFLLSCMSYAVGLGNVWRFPYLVYRNGGGAFLVPYIIMLFTMGLPLFFLELIVGQYSGLGANVAFFRMSPIFQGLGYCTLVVILLITIYYHVITAWTLFYISKSFTSNLGWGHCQHDFNSDDCYSENDNKLCRESNENMTFWRRQCASVADVCANYSYVFEDAEHCRNGSDLIPIRQVGNRVYASEEYYRDFAMGIRGADWEHWGELRWEMVGWLALAWVIAYLCLVRGVQSMGKAVYFTALFPYVVLTALLVRGATLDGATEGIIFYIKPDFSRLASPEVWGDAASQTFYALGIGCASLITLSSYNPYRNNCHRDAIIVAVGNLFTAIFAGFGVFSVLGVMAHETKQEVEDVVESGPGLAFIAYPEAILRMPGAPVWAVLFFFMLFILGLGSQFAGVEAMSAAIIDEWPVLQRRKWAVTGGVCLACFILAIPMCFSGGVYLFTLLDWHTAYWAVFLIGAAETIVVAYVYGVDRFLENIADMSMKLTGLRTYWKVAWLVLAPVSLIGVVAFTLYSFTNASFGTYIFPRWVDALGWLIGISTLAPLPAFAIYRLVLGNERGWDLLRPMKSWGPRGNAYEEPTKQSITVDTVAMGVASAMYENCAFEPDSKESTPSS